jgi:hypothetical protein
LIKAYSKAFDTPSSINNSNYKTFKTASKTVEKPRKLVLSKTVENLKNFDKTN